jgi:tetratricopeptide (TPR) repeat protein
LTTGPESPDGDPVGAYQNAALHYQAGQVRAALGDKDGAIKELRSSLRDRPRGERRSRALSEAELAELLLSRGRLEEACGAWQGFLDDSALVASGRARRARDRMPRLLRPYAQERCVQALLTRAGIAPGRC